MKSFAIAVAFAAIVAYSASLVLANYQTAVDVAYATSSVRL
jgi:hypothetical protein